MAATSEPTTTSVVAQQTTTTDLPAPGLVNENFASIGGLINGTVATISRMSSLTLLVTSIILSLCCA